MELVGEFHAILLAELADKKGWELLIKLTEEANIDEVALKFRDALREEQEHLDYARKLNEYLAVSQVA